MLADDRPVGLLLNNAAVMFPPVRHETADGFELQRAGAGEWASGVRVAKWQRYEVHNGSIWFNRSVV